LTVLGSTPPRVEIYEVGPRDGLQNELRALTTVDKARLVEALADSGLKRIELTSFVSPRWIPQLADAEKLMGLVRKRDDVVYSALVPNVKGLARAKAVGLKEAVSTVREVSKEARAAGMRVRCYLSTVWGCPYEGKTPVHKVVELVKQLADLGLYQLSLGDTIGVGTPTQTAEIITEVSRILPLPQLALHLHDTRGTALANALIGLSMGITTFDSSIGGLGGCPYAPGAAGNLATEDLLYMLEGMGVQTGVNLGKLVEAGELAQELIGRKLSGKYLQAALGEREKQAGRARGEKA
jgi:hydroxymethylglutaryl-CoA lyase